MSIKRLDVFRHRRREGTVWAQVSVSHLSNLKNQVGMGLTIDFLSLKRKLFDVKLRKFPNTFFYIIYLTK